MGPRPAATLLADLERLGVRLGLEPFRSLLAALGRPERNLVAALVAGTNGKGSTAAMLDAIVRAGGRATGLYTSPHLERVEERIRLGGAAIGSAPLGAALERVLAAARSAGLEPPTYFEATTAAAFALFADARLDLAVLEVGLGGRLDATNACEPRLSVVTPIALDHTELLGSTLAAIAREKAGVFRRDRPVVLAAQEPAAARALAEAAVAAGARALAADDLVRIEETEERGLAGSRFTARLAGELVELELPLAGPHQVANAVTAIAAARVLAEEGLAEAGARALGAGLLATRWPGRLESVEPPPGEATVLLDAAHNPHGTAALARFLDRLARPFVLLFGALADKDSAAMLRSLAPRAAALVLARPASPRALAPELLLAQPGTAGARVEPEPAAALGAALDAARATGVDLVVVAGSIYLVGAARVELRRRWGRPAAL